MSCLINFSPSYANVIRMFCRRDYESFGQVLFFRKLDTVERVPMATGT